MRPPSARLATFRSRQRNPARSPGPGSAAAVAVLAGATVAWAALPMHGASRGARPMLVIAACCAALTVGQLGTGMLAWQRRSAQREQRYLPPLIALPRQAWDTCLLVPWPQVMLVAVLVLEALHRARPWHTAVLGGGLLACLLALHLAESAASPAALAPQRPLIVAGLGLAGLSAAATLLPGTGPGSGWLAVIAGVAAVVAAALALPLQRGPL